MVKIWLRVIIMKAILVIAAIAANSILCMAQINRQTNPVGAVFAHQGGTMSEGTFHFINGGYDVYTIASADKDFQPASLYYGQEDADKAKVDALAPDGKVPTAMNCFVVHTPEGYVMFDTGLPSAKGGKTIERLKSTGITPEEIKAIFVTHSHFDHIGGMLDADGKAAYPSATIYISSDELAFMRETMNDTAIKLLPLTLEKYYHTTSCQYLLRGTLQVIPPISSVTYFLWAT